MIDTDDQSSASRPQTPSDATTTSTQSRIHPLGFQPLITPLSDASAVGSHSFYSPLPFEMPLPFTVGQPAPRPRSAQPSDQDDSTEIETPGMIAAQDDPTANTANFDPSLDVFPGESIANAKARQDDNLRLTLPQPGNPNDLLKVPTAPPSAPTESQTPAPALTQAPTPANPKPIPVNEADAPIPVDKIQVITPVHAPIPSPYDVLNR
jgi:hypothetical protein